MTVSDNHVSRETSQARRLAAKAADFDSVIVGSSPTASAMVSPFGANDRGVISPVVRSLVRRRAISDSLPCGEWCLPVRMAECVAGSILVASR